MAITDPHKAVDVAALKANPLLPAYSSSPALSTMSPPDEYRLLSPRSAASGKPCVVTKVTASGGIGQGGTSFICSDIVSFFATQQICGLLCRLSQKGAKRAEWNELEPYQTSLIQRKLIKERLGLFGIGDVEYEHDPALIGFDVPLVNIPRQSERGRPPAHFRTARSWPSGELRPVRLKAVWLVKARARAGPRHT
jgi:hypothetical protein